MPSALLIVRAIRGPARRVPRGGAPVQRRGGAIAALFAALLALGSRAVASAEPPEAARVEIATGALVRALSLEGAGGPDLIAHRGAGAALATRAEIHPGAFFEGSALADLGAYFELSRSMGLRLPGPDGNEARGAYGTRELGITARRRIGAHAIATRLGYGNHRTIAALEPPPGAGIPSVEYRFLRIEARALLLAVDELRVTPSFAYLPVFDAGPLGDVAGDARIQSGGITAGLELAYRLRGAFDLFVSYEYRRFFHDFDPAAGTTPVIVGALDQVHLASAGARYVFRRAARPSAEK